MTTELQDLAWSILPKEFKEEVKSLYEKFYNEKPNSDCSYGYLGLLIKLFGIHNLTSDAEGEELLTVKAKTVREMYAANERLAVNFPPSIADTNADAINHVLRHLFGSKCLPDVPSSEPRDCDNPLADKDGCRWRNDGKCAFNNACYFEPLNPQEPKPAEPKFKLGDKVKDISSPHDDGIYKVDDIKKSSDGFLYHIQGLIGVSDVKESDLEPYTEPQKNHFPDPTKMVAEHPNRELCDKLMIKGFEKHNRLHIAAMLAAGMLADDYSFYPIDRAIELADKLIAECEKGGDHA